MSKIPQFSSVQAESDFWDTHDFTDFLEETEAVDINSLPMRPGRISLDLDPTSITQLEAVAQRQGTDPKTLVHAWVMEHLTSEAKAG